jgi:hypothetical protein
MLEKQIEIIEYIQHANGNVSLKKMVNILENGNVIASFVSRETVEDIDANADIPDKAKPHLKALATSLKREEKPLDSSNAIL